VNGACTVADLERLLLGYLRGLEPDARSREDSVAAG